MRPNIFVSNTMHVIDDKNDMFKDKPIDDRGVPEILFDIAAEVDQVAPL